MSNTVERTEKLLEPILRSLGLDLWDIEFRASGPKWLLRVYIDREIGGGVTLSDCEAVSRDLSAALDVDDFISHAYTLEVSSPGLDRALTRPEHFIRFGGKSVRIKTRQAVGNDKVFRGKLLGIADSIIRVEVAEGHILDIPLSNIAEASLEVEF